MNPVRVAWRRLRWIGRRAELDRGLDDEIRFHIERQTEKNLARGMTADEARRAALVAFGAVERAREGTRDQFRLGAIEDVARDLRRAARSLRRTPGFTVVALLMLSLGIGATTAMFSVIEGVLLKPLPYPGQDRLVELQHEARGVGLSRLRASPAVYFTYRDHARAFDAVGLWNWNHSPVTVTGLGDPESVESAEVTPEILPMLGADPIVGRGFTAADDRPGSPPTVIVTYGFWQRHFAGADPLARTLIVDGVPRQIVGVLPPAFRFFSYPAELFYPLQPVRSGAAFPSFSGRGLARLAPGVTLAQADADVARMIPILEREFGQPGVAARMRFRPALVPLKSAVVGTLGDTLWLLMGTVALLLLIACANVSNLVLLRTESRRTELAVRASLGAGWGAIARVVVAESVVLGLGAAAGGIALAYASLPWLLSRGADDLPQILAVRIDPMVLLVSLGTALLTTVLFALLPIARFALPRLSLSDALHKGARTTTGGRDVHRTRHALVAAQVALALVLLTGCGLMIRTFVLLRQVDPGFRDPADVLSFQITVPDVPASAGEPGPADLERDLGPRQAILDRLSAVPGVTSAAYASFNDALPLDGDGRSASIVAEGRPPVEGATGLQELQFVSPRFFETLGAPVVAGREFEWADVYQGRPVAMVSENMARANWGSADAALGKRIGASSSGPWSDVVGVMKDVHHGGLDAAAPQVAAFPAVPSATAVFLVRSSRVGTAGFLEDLRRAAWSANAAVSLANVRSLGELYEASMARTSMTLQLLATTGGIALLLGVVGIYGTVAYAVTQRRREIGIRLALGAPTGEIRRIFVAHALTIAGAGTIVGLLAAAVLTRLMRSQLFGVGPMDPVTHASVLAGLLGAAALASAAAARRASRVDPAEVLKSE